MRERQDGKNPAASTDPSEMYRVTATVITKTTSITASGKRGQIQESADETCDRFATMEFQKHRKRVTCHHGKRGQCTSTSIDPFRNRSASQTARAPFENIKQQCGESKRTARRAQDIGRADIPAAHRAYIFAALQLHQTDSQKECRRSGMRREEPGKAVIRR